MAGNEPPYLNVGTDVSAKYKGAFCEAKVKKVNRSVKVKVILKECHSSVIVTDDHIDGRLMLGATVVVKQPNNGQVSEGVINKLTDSSMYTVVFDDGDEATLRRSQLCLKGDKHFTESETLDNLPLSHPEHFGTPVLQKKTKKAVNSGNDTESEAESDTDESIPKRQTYKGRHQELVGKVMMYESTERRKGGTLAIPVLVVLPDAHDIDLRTKDHILVKSFKDNKFSSVLKKELKEFNRDMALKNEISALKNAFEKALTYFDSRDLPASWKKEDLLGSEEENEEDESSDDEQNEEKDRFVAQLYKFMDDRGTPINKGPSVGVHDLNLYRFFKIVQNLGGYNKVTNLDKWRVVYNKMGLPMSNSAGSQMKNAYKKYLHAFEDFYRKLGSTMGTLSRPGRQRNNSGRNIIPFRGREKETAAQRLKKEEIDDSSSEKSKNAKSDDTSDTDSIFKDESDTETTVKRSVTRREKERLKEESKEQKPEREKRESTRGKTEEKKEEEEKRSTRRDKDDDKVSIKDEKLSKAEEKSEEKKKEENTKDDPIKKRVTRRKSGRVDKSEKEEEEEEVEEKEPKKKGNSKVADKEEKKEEKKLTRKDMKELKDKKATKEEKGGNKEEKNEKAASVKQEDSGDEEEELSEKADDDEKRKHLPCGTKVKVKYGRGKNIKIYEAKVVEASKEAGQKTYLVHYAGWNNRYDEWIKRERIVSIVDRPDTKNSKKVTAVNVSPKSTLKQQLVSQIQKKRGRPTSGTPPPTKANEFRIPQTKQPPTANKGRPTRSNSLEMKVIDILPSKMRTTRRSSGMTDNSDVQSRASDESYDTEDEMETDEKPPNLSETNSAPKTPEQEEPESELETSMEEEAPELEAVKPIEELNLTSEDMTPPPPVVQVKEEDNKSTEEPVREEPVLEPIAEKIVKETPKEKTVKEVKEKPVKEVKEKQKDVKEKPKEVKEKQKEVKEKPKEVKEKPKEIKEKPKEVKDKPKDIKEKPKEIKEKPKEVKEQKAKETRDMRRLLLPETKPAEVKSTSIYDFEDTEISDDFKIEEKRFEKKEPPTELDLDEILKAVLTPDSSKGDRVEEMKEELEREKEELERKRQELEKGKIQLEEMIKEDAKLDMKTPDDAEKKVKAKKKDLKDSAKKDTKDKQIKRGRPFLAEMTGTPKQLDFSPMSSPSPNSSLNLGKKTLVFQEETPEKIKKETGDSKTKKEKKTAEKTPVVEGKISDTECKDTADNSEKKKVKKKIKKKIFGENLNDSSEPLAFSDLTKDNLDKLKAEVKKEPKTPKSSAKDKLTKPKDTKKSKEIENKDMSPLGTCVQPDVTGDVLEVNKVDRKDNKRVMSPDIPLEFRSKVAKLDKSENQGEASLDSSIVMPNNQCNKDSESKLPGGPNLFRSAVSPCANIVPDSDTKNSAVTMVIDNTPPRTPEHQRNEQKSCDPVNVPLVKEVAMKSGEDNSTVCNGGDHVSNSGGESPPAGVSSVTSAEGTESSVVPSSESSNDVEVAPVKRKRETEDPSPTKKTKRRSSNKNSRGSERNKNKFTGSDSEDTNSCKLSSPSHTPASPLKQPEQARSPRPSKYNFINLEEASLLEGEKKIEFITDRMKQLRTLYFQLKAEVATIDKKRKRARRKERDNSQSSHLDNESS